jgi:hypothetical protein
MKLKPPHVAIATLIVLIVFLAADCAVLRNPFGGNDAAMLVLCALPMANKIATSVSLAVVSLLLTALFSIVALEGGWIAHRFINT